eukprot:CAMPEP_0173130048 /NCGR_PEP_ID=MMETSP1102-20130122/59684_1 /TAXON_ID=49646 /ORGANISM="Geminigera sp., Strain Caron Lab Isolate" /LENGTH=242 /DNA_ID=CAMNT_0014040841 /DNA_START=40 /DNA_END=765 /DNA_ORIENTATION=+
MECSPSGNSKLKSHLVVVVGELNGVRHLPLRAQKGERLYAVAEIGHNTSIQAANGIDRQHFTSSLRACSNAASASQDVHNTMEWGEEFVVGISRKLAREGLLRLVVEIRAAAAIPTNHHVMWSAESDFLSIASLKDKGFTGWLPLCVTGEEPNKLFYNDSDKSHSTELGSIFKVYVEIQIQKQPEETVHAPFQNSKSHLDASNPANLQTVTAAARPERNTHTNMTRGGVFLSLAADLRGAGK